MTDGVLTPDKLPALVGQELGGDKPACVAEWLGVLYA